MGAFEYRPHPPTVTVVAVAKPKRVARFAATTSDPDPGDVVTVRWHFDDGASATGASVSHAFSKAGTHTATAKATDLDGYSAHASVSVTVGRPILSHPKLKPRKGKGKHLKKCTRWVALKGSFKHQDVAGANRFRFRDHKLKARPLSPPRGGDHALGASAPVEASFTIKRP
jgi:PKD domain